MNHTLTSANGSTHAKIAILAVTVSVVFMAAVAGFGGGKADVASATYAPTVVKASTLISVAGDTGSKIR
jgi:hypothetical protein